MAPSRSTEGFCVAHISRRTLCGSAWIGIVKGVATECDCNILALLGSRSKDSRSRNACSVKEFKEGLAAKGQRVDHVKV